MTIREQLILVREARARAWLDCAEHIKFCLKTGQTVEEALRTASTIAATNLAEAADLRRPVQGPEWKDAMKEDILALTAWPS